MGIVGEETKFWVTVWSWSAEVKFFASLSITFWLLGVGCLHLVACKEWCKFFLELAFRDQELVSWQLSWKERQTERKSISCASKEFTDEEGASNCQFCDLIG